jgi:hypothetical protein
MRARHAMRLAVVLCGFACIHPAAAQSWPARPLTMVVPFAAGGGTDVLGRIVGRRLSEILGQQAIVENVGGAGGMVGSARVAKAPSDGYQFVLGSRADAINQTLYKIRSTISRLISRRWSSSPRARSGPVARARNSGSLGIAEHTLPSPAERPDRTERSFLFRRRWELNDAWSLCCSAMSHASSCMPATLPEHACHRIDDEYLVLELVVCSVNALDRLWLWWLRCRRAADFPCR